MKINYDKSTVYRVGLLSNTNAKFYSQRKLIWSDNPVEMLGVKITRNKQEIMSLNLDNVIQKGAAILALWEACSPSLFGRILIVNSLVASLFVYKFTVLPLLSQQYVNDIHNMFKRFIWNGKKSKIKFKILQGLKQDGGAGLVNVEKKNKALKIQWVFKACENIQISTLMQVFINTPLANKIWETQLESKDIRKLFPESFWRDVLLSWMEIS